MKLKQLSLFLENKPGALTRPGQLLAQAKINIHTLSLADTQQFGIYAFTLKNENRGVRVFRFDDPDQAIALLQTKITVTNGCQPAGVAEHARQIMVRPYFLLSRRRREKSCATGL
jgi:hypothetical protein